ncbi:rRNA pseudouridine synthase [Candidatus Woesearchaeota archaeon]|nr:rRNA pseudouridine synthase [Candidatus Woesearchaeota archaeon]
MMRLQKLLSMAGIASRRKSEDLIREGRVFVNGVKADIGMSASPNDDIKVDGEKIKFQNKRYIILYKPAGYVTTTADKFAKKKVVDLVKTKERVYPVGRLDADTEGLLLLTNDGDFANRIAHPSHELEKTYTARLKARITRQEIDKINQGIIIEGRKVEASAKIINERKNLVAITIHEGRHKIVKRLFKSLGNYVLELRRVRLGPLTLQGLKPGKWRDLKEKELEMLNC